jgi:hypothetical protein
MFIIDRTQAALIIAVFFLVGIDLFGRRWERFVS